MKRFRLFLFTFMLLLPFLVGAGILLAFEEDSAPDRYDANQNGVIERDEVLEALIDYIMERITREELIEVLDAYIFESSDPEPTPTPVPTPDSTPTPAPRQTVTSTPEAAPAEVTIIGHEALTELHSQATEGAMPGAPQELGA